MSRHSWRDYYISRNSWTTCWDKRLKRGVAGTTHLLSLNMNNKTYGKNTLVIMKAFDPVCKMNERNERERGGNIGGGYSQRSLNATKVTIGLTYTTVLPQAIQSRHKNPEPKRHRQSGRKSL